VPSRSRARARVDDGVALAVSSAVFLAGAHAARTAGVSAFEQRAFRAVNNLPSSLHVPVWALMQLGSLGGALGAGAAVAALGRRPLGLRLAIAGATTWAAAKVAKQFVQRGRPEATLEEARVLGRAQSGLGYPSGHAAVAATLAVVAARELGAPWRPVVLGTALAVGPTRVYVGAHLPLDIVGGAAFGVAVGILSRA
jgi:membrane-associated phospholipid phosphatase